MDMPENLLVRRKRVITELVKGKGFAAQLQTLLRNPPAHDGGASTLVSELTREIRRSFTQVILELTSCGGSPQIYQIPTASAFSGDRTLEDSGETTGKKNKKGRRGRYNKSKKNPETWSSVSETQEDGGAWRKYGQKNILHSENPRCYFRCTHKFGQGCKATKQVQRTSDGLYHTTYFGYHTCNDPRLKKINVSSDTPNNHQSILEDNDDDNGTIDVTAVKKEEETALDSEISVTKSPDNNNNNNNNNNNDNDNDNDKYYGGSDYIWEDIIGESSNYDTSFYASSSTTLNDFDMEGFADLDTHFPIDEPRRYDHYYPS